MIAARLGYAAVAALLLMPSDALAKGKGNGGGKSNGNGPAFCRSGAGHPVHGWAWCREKGWDRQDRFWNRVEDRDDRARRRDDRARRDRAEQRDDGGWWPF